MQFYWFVLGVLSVWRVTHLLSAEDGPWQLVVWIRRKAGAGFWGSLLDCFYCLSLWIAVPFAILIEHSLNARFCIWLAFSGGAILLQRLTAEPSPPVPTYFEHGEHNDAMLRESKNPSPTGHTDAQE
jgi:hypothetical protein